MKFVVVEFSVELCHCAEMYFFFCVCDGILSEDTSSEI